MPTWERMSSVFSRVKLSSVFKIVSWLLTFKFMRSDVDVQAMPREVEEKYYWMSTLAGGRAAGDCSQGRICGHASKVYSRETLPFTRKPLYSQKQH